MKRARAPLNLLVKPIGAVCNLDCAYCFYLSKKDLYPGETSFKMTDRVLKRLTKQYINEQPEGIPEVSFGWQGGEPTLMGLDFFRKAVAYQKKYARSGMKITNGLQTNGVLLDDEWCKFLHEENFLVGVSVDGPEEMHNKFRLDRRGEGSFARVMKGIEALRRNCVEFNTLTVVESDNGDHPPEVYDFLKEIGSTFFQFIPIVEALAGGEVGERTVAPDQYGRFMCGVFDRWLEKNDVGRIYVQKFDMTLGIAMGYPAAICVHSEVCGRSVAMEHNGDLYSCDHFVDPEHLLGNIMKSTFVDMVDGAAQTKFGADKKDALHDKCLQCRYLPLCRGACPKDRVGGPGEGGLNYLCEGYKAFYEHSFSVFKKMAVCLRLQRPASDYRLVDDAGRLRPVEPDAGRGRIGRNEPCPCGSGMKYKKCCMLKST